jgi:arylsulfatase A-like enzyme
MSVRQRVSIAFALCALFLVTPVQATDPKPNIVFIMADDLGNADLGYRGGQVKTPHIDKLASEGVRLESFYGQQVCTPSRATLMTGRYPMRYGLQTLVIFPSHTYGLPTEERTLPQALKEVGYRTLMVGKWHLSHADKKFWPQNRGKEERAHEAGGIAQGARTPASNDPFRGGKGGIYEGGVRVPAFVHWPAKLQPRVIHEPVGMVDVMPTLLALAGGPGSADRPVDGKDMWPTLADGKPSPNADFLINLEAFRGAIRKGQWKLIKVALLPGKTELFDLAKDPRETTNVADQHPDVVQDLEARLLAYATQQKPSEWIKAQPTFVGEQGKTVFDPDFDTSDGGLPREKPRMPAQ